VRTASIKALLDKSKQDLAKIECEYNKSLHAKIIDPNLKIDIKNFCENLRSVLDYLSRDIREKYCPPASITERFYFPILPDQTQFEAQMSRWFPNLQVASPDLYLYLESIQPYKSENNKWLRLFNKVNNENKHGDLVEQCRTETKQIKVTTNGGAEVSWNPNAVRFGSGVFIGGVPVDPRTQMPVPHTSQSVQIISWVDFKFSGIDVSAVWLLRESYKGVSDISNQVQKYL